MPGQLECLLAKGNFTPLKISQNNWGEHTSIMFLRMAGLALEQWTELEDILGFLALLSLISDVLL